jgi:hypothetical protein
VRERERVAMLSITWCDIRLAVWAWRNDSA